MLSAAYAWLKDGDGDALEAALFRFQQATFVQVMVLTDEVVGDRVVDYLELAGNLTDTTHPDYDLVRAVNRDNTIVQESLGAHVQGDPLPDYEPPPLGDLAALRRWGAESRNLPK